MTAKHFYITTPIYYVNDAPHIGHAYTTVLADVLKRYHRLLGYETFMLTGTDEHGQKVQQAAAKREVSPQQHVDEYNVRFKDMWSKMNIDYDHFIRTTHDSHKQFVQKCLQDLWDKGEIYIKEYQGWYSVGEERFFSEEELVDGKDPISNRPVEWISEKNYFFKMSKYQQALIDHIEANPDFIQPDFRKNEVLGFLRQELTDLCISRPKSRLSWGIPLPFDTDYVTYVWFDALLNYISGVLDRKYSNGDSLWPVSFHLIGKDILTTHCVYWTTMLMGMQLPLPQHILAHGWWLNGGAKMSKSSGTAINPTPYMDAYGVDTFRYFLIRDMAIGQDSSFSDEAFIKRTNSDLANDLGNGLNRVHKQISTHCNGVIPHSTCTAGVEETQLRTVAQEVLQSVQGYIPTLKLTAALEDTMRLVRAVNRYLEQKAPWKLAKDEQKAQELALVLYTSAEALRIALCLLQPVMPQKCSDGLAMLGINTPVQLQDLQWGVLQSGTPIGAGQPLFPRIQTEEKPTQPSPKNAPNPATIPPLQKAEFRVATVTNVAEHPDADSLYVLTVDYNNTQRTICSGLRAHYAPEQLLNRKIVLLANLKPAKMRGVVSEGMLLAADGDNGAVLLISPHGDIPDGSILQFGEQQPQPAEQIKMKDFDKIVLQVNDKVVTGDNLLMHYNQLPIECDAPNGASVH